MSTTTDQPRRPSLLAALFTRPPRGPPREWAAAAAGRWAARAGLPRGAAKRVLAGKDGKALLSLPYAAVADAAAGPAEADAVWAALGALKAQAAGGAGEGLKKGGPSPPRRAPSPTRIPSVRTSQFTPAPPPPSTTPLTPDHLGGVDPAALRASLAAWAGWGAPRTLAEAATASRSLDRGLDGRAWAKLCRDCGLLVPGRLDATGADIIFKRVIAGAPGMGGSKGGQAPGRRAPRAAWGCGVGGAPGGAAPPPPPRRLDFPGALVALRAVAAESGRPAGLVLRSVLAGEPLAAAVTRPDAWIKWHDDKDAWTGVYGRGGPSLVDGRPGRAGATPGSGVAGLAALVDRSLRSDVRGTPVPSGPSLRKALAAASGGLGSPSPSPQRVVGAAAAAAAAAAGQSEVGVTPIVHPQQPPVVVAGTPFSATGDRDTFFTPAQQPRFYEGEDDDEEEEEEERVVVEDVRGDDNGLAAGAASPCPPPPPAHLRASVSPSPSPLAHASGCVDLLEGALQAVFAAFALFGAPRQAGAPPASPARSISGRRRSSSVGPPSAACRAAAPAEASVRASWDAGFSARPACAPTPTPPPLPLLDGPRWAKLVREAGLLGPGTGLDSTAADLIFARARAEGVGKAASGTGARRLSYARFKAALRLVAAAAHLPVDSVVDAVLSTGGPGLGLNTTQPDHVKWHDDAALYTGTAAQGGPDVGGGGVDLAALTDRARPWRGAK